MRTPCARQYQRTTAGSRASRRLRDTSGSGRAGLGGCIPLHMSPVAVYHNGPSRPPGRTRQILSAGEIWKMTRKSWVGSVLCALALATACSKDSPNPSSPTAAKPASAKAAADGTTLKASAPVSQSPADGARLGSGQPLTLVVGNATATFVPTTPLTYEFEIFNNAGTLIDPVARRDLRRQWDHDAQAERAARGRGDLHLVGPGVVPRELRALVGARLVRRAAHRAVISGATRCTTR